jgi:prefoldin subunit 5
MSDNGTLRDHIFDVIYERNKLRRQVEALNAQIEELIKQLSELLEVDND